MKSRAFIGVVVCVWLVGALTSGGVTFFYVQSQQAPLARDHNEIVCVFRKFVLQSRARSVQTAADASQPSAARARAKAAVNASDDLLSHLITFPRSFDCAQFG